MRLAARVIVSSDAHKRELVEYLGVDERRVRVIPMGANTGLFRPLDGEAAAGAAGPEGEAGRFVLIIGPVERWWCRYETVFEAFAPLSLSHPDLRLVVVGDDASEAAGRLRALAERLNISSRVLWLGRVPAARLNILLNRAACTVYPAWDTGCSLNVLDSMAAGCPVVTSPLSLLPELLGEAGVWADPFSPAGMEAALRRLVEDPEFRRACSEACLARAAERTWEKTARATLEVYREAAG